jgi:methylated-DNA-[protein]-cysteine S-methyltransferase
MKKTTALDHAIALFPSELGWMAVLGSGHMVRRLVYGYPSPEAAVRALGVVDLSAVGMANWYPRLIARLQAYARHGKDDFRDVKLQLEPRTLFQRRVIAACRRIPCGSTSTYAQLAAAAGSPGAARAVGTVMKANPVSLIIPCHRVLSAAGGIGGYSHPLGLDIKARLLALEAAGKTRRRAAQKSRTSKQTPAKRVPAKPKTGRGLV